MLSKIFLTLCLISILYPHLTFAQQWLANGAAEYASRCALGTEASGEYVCFTYTSDITTAATGGVYQGYANASGTGFALVPPGDGVGESSLLTTADRQVSVGWEGDNTAHVTIRNMEGGAWKDVQDVDVQNPDQTYTFVL